MDHQHGVGWGPTASLNELQTKPTLKGVQWNLNITHIPMGFCLLHEIICS